MICAAEALATKNAAPKVREIHLMGAAVGANGDWSRLNAAVHGLVYNYHSRDDKVLRFFYTLAQGGSPAAGCGGMTTRLKKIKNVDVTKQVSDHSAYCKSLSLA